MWLKGSFICLFACLQGQENDIILISLVRSNKEGKIGYLSQMSRLCVAISRARCGLYLFGNHTQLGRAFAGWRVGWFEICYCLLKVVYSKTNTEIQLFCSLFGRKIAQFPTLITSLFAVFVLFIALEQSEMVTQGIAGRSSIWMLCDLVFGPCTRFGEQNITGWEQRNINMCLIWWVNLRIPRASRVFFSSFVLLSLHCSEFDY